MFFPGKELAMMSGITAKSKRILLLLLVSLLLCGLSPAAAELSAEYLAELTPEQREYADMMSFLWEDGFTIEGETLVFPEGITVTGWLPEEMSGEYKSILGTEKFPEDGLIFDGGGFYASDCPLTVTSLRLPKSLKIMGGESISFWTGKELVIPEGVEAVFDPFYIVSVDRLVLPSTLRIMNGGDFSSVSVKEFVIAENSPYFQVVDGVIFSKDGKTLVYYPEAKQDLHYDVPSGVEIIGPSAFAENLHLQTVSLPIGLKTICRSAFYRCGHLISVNVPLTVKAIHSRAFSDCVNLQRVTLPPALQGLLSGREPGEDEEYTDEGAFYVFDNCPALGTAFAGDEAATSGAPCDPDTYVVEAELSFQAIASPLVASDGIGLYAEENVSGKVLTHFPSGSLINVTQPARTLSDVRAGRTSAFLNCSFYDSGNGTFLEGYVEKSQIVPIPYQDCLFEITSLSPRAEKVTLYQEPMTNSKRSLLKLKDCTDVSFSFWWANAPWVHVSGFAGNGDHFYGSVFIGDAELYRERKDDGKTYAIAVASEIGNRVNLRQDASKESRSLGKYFSGAQMEILGEKGDFWKVRLYDGSEGYMMKTYVRIVPEK